MAMTFEQAITIAIPDVLEKLGHLPTKKTTREYWYLSPLRFEKTASFKVDLRKNLWFDFGTYSGGGIIKFVEAWLKSEGKPSSYKNALAWLDGLSGIQPSVRIYDHSQEPEEKKRLELRSVTKLRSSILISYLEERGIPHELATQYLRELSIQDNDTGKRFTSIGFKNDKGAYEHRRRNFKGCIGPKAISSLRGINPDPEGVHLFEGVFDFLSVLVFKEKSRLDDQVIVLNSAMMLKHALPLLLASHYKYVYTWFDNDDTGQKATEEVREFCLAHPPLEYTPMNSYYAEHKDVNEWLMHLLS